MNNVRIIPAVLSYSKDDLKEKISRAEGIFERLQFDVVGKVFSKDVTVDIEALERLNSSCSFDVHLMVNEPEKYLARCDVIGVERVFGHVEYMKDRSSFIEHAFALGMEVGLGIDLTTSVSVVEKEIFELDAILLMSVFAGKSGQQFDERVIEKIRKVRELREDITICVDGGIRPTTLKKCYDAGAGEFGVTSFMWESEDLKKARVELEEAVL